jgi:hypothetical protein
MHVYRHPYYRAARGTYTHQCINTMGAEVTWVHSHQAQGVDDIVDDVTVLIIPYYCTISMMMVYLTLLLLQLIIVVTPLLLHRHSRTAICSKLENRMHQIDKLLHLLSIKRIKVIENITHSAIFLV